MNNSAKYDRDNYSPGHTPTVHTLPSASRRLLALLLILCLLLPSLSGCFKVINFLLIEDVSKGDSALYDRFARPKTTTSIVEEPDPTPTEAPKESLFDQEIRYLTGYDIGLAEKDSESLLTKNELHELLAQTYEAIVGEIDISQSNPNFPGSDASKKLLRIELYDSDYFTEDSDFGRGMLGYYDTFSFVFRIYYIILELQGWDEDDHLYPNEILDIFNIAVALIDWTADKSERSKLDMEELFGKHTAEIEMQPMNKLILARMMVNAVESIADYEIPTIPSYEPKDTDDIFAWKAARVLVWMDGEERDEFNPSKKVLKSDFLRISASYHTYLKHRYDIDDEESCPYGAIVSALAALVEASKNFNIPDIYELTVLNEKPYPWHVCQFDTGECGDANCMPSSVEMAFRYQNLADIPSTEMLREQYFADGRGWTDPIAIEAMEEYGLDFTIGYASEYDEDELFAEFLKILDEGNIIYVTYIEEAAEEGHATIIKGYYMFGDLTKFIMSDPSDYTYGPYAYAGEYLKDPYQLIENIQRTNIPRYFVIPHEFMTR